MLQVAARGNLEEFIKVYTADPSRLEVKDNKGQRPLHAAAAKGHTNIVDFIVEHHGGESKWSWRSMECGGLGGGGGGLPLDVWSDG